MGPGNRQQGDREVFDASGFVRRVGEFIDSAGLIPPQAKVLAGVSGGADSVALLAILHELAGQDERGWQLSVGHLNHGLRESAEEDEQFVRQLAEKLGLPCHVETRDVAAEAAEAGKTVEEAGRDARMEFFARIAAEQGIPCVAVGHHADDNVETVLHRIFRGTHLRGLAGIPASRRIGGGVQLIRPLLNFRRSEVEQFCTERGLEWCTDETNADLKYTRNVIRHELLPLLRDKLNPRVEEAIERLSEGAGRTEDYLQWQARELLYSAGWKEGCGGFEFDVELFADEPPVIRAYAMRLVAEDAEVPFAQMTAERFAELARLCDLDGPVAVALPGNFVARRAGTKISICQALSSEPPEHRIVTLPLDGEVDIGEGKTIACSLDMQARITYLLPRLRGQQRVADKASKPPGEEFIDADKVEGELICMGRQPGDRFRPLGCHGSQTVSDFLTNSKSSIRQRESVRCICDSKGIVYLAPLRIDERVKVTEKTKRILFIDASSLVV